MVGTRPQAKIDLRAYSKVSDVYADFALIFNNAKRFNANGSQIYVDGAMVQYADFQHGAV